VKHVITAIVENQPGVLARIIGLISGRGFNIENLNVAPTGDPSVSRLTMTVPGDNRVLEQVTKQLNKLINVIKVSDLTRRQFVNRELLLAEVAAAPGKRKAISELAVLAKAEIIAVLNDSVVMQKVGQTNEVEEFLALISKEYKVIDISRSGVIPIVQSEKAASARL
jgi:acetolactate synthase I/III small subunit